MSAPIFDPFQDRLSRDIRNSLSSALAASLKENSMEKIIGVANDFKSDELAPCYVSYIEDRLKRYSKALPAIWGNKENPDPIWQALVLWDQELFFEVHEVLEHAWYDAKDEYRMVLQAMIRAAGAFLKRELGYNKQSARIAGKAVEVLENTTYLNTYFDVPILIDALNDIEVRAPKLMTNKSI